MSKAFGPNILLAGFVADKIFRYYVAVLVFFMLTSAILFIDKRLLMNGKTCLSIKFDYYELLFM